MPAEAAAQVFHVIISADDPSRTVKNLKSLASSTLMQTRKEKYESDVREVADRLSKKSEFGDLDFWKEYFYWSWRCLLFVLFFTVATNFDPREGIAGSFDHTHPYFGQETFPCLYVSRFSSHWW